jgi:hypothetical protein
MKHHRNLNDDGPTAADLAAIDAQWPLIEAEMAVLDAEIRILTVERPSELDWRRLRRAEHGVLRAALELMSTTTATPLRQAA